MTVRVRFAPSPTGAIHIGNIRTAIFNWLFARSKGGTFILRVEDTDRERSSEAFEAIIHEEMEWLGLHIDEGGQMGGDHGPYRQMERLRLYREHAQILVDKGLAYPCFCTGEELEKAREAALASGQVGGYTGTCRDLSVEDRERLRGEGRPEALRFRWHGDGDLVFEDLIRGEITFHGDTLDDLVLMKSDGSPTYNFACCVDDHLMEISHVLRGEDHISNTPKQLMLYQAFGWEPPAFGHLSLILDKERQRLKKRSGSDEVFLGRYRDKGFLPEALFNYMALLGWSPGGDREIMEREDMIREFTLERVNASPAVFSREKLAWINASYLRNLSTQELLKRVQPFLDREGLQASETQLMILIPALKERVETLEELAQEAAFYMGPLEISDTDKALAIFQQDGVQEVFECLESRLAPWTELQPEDAAAILKKVRKECNVKGKLVFQPVRWALTGRGSGPELNDAMAFLGPKECQKRLQEIRTWLEEKKDG